MCAARVKRARRGLVATVALVDLGAALLRFELLLLPARLHRALQKLLLGGLPLLLTWLGGARAPCQTPARACVLACTRMLLYS